MAKIEGGVPRTRQRLSNARIAELLDVATVVFLEKGFAAANTADIAERANASKTTFYKRFPTKEDLFLAVIERHTENVFLQLGQLPIEGKLNATLLGFGQSLLDILLSQQHTALVRLIGAEVTRQPELAEHFYRSGAKRAEGMLEQYLAGQIGAGRLRGATAGTMARLFLNLVTGTPVRWVVLGFDPGTLSNQTIQTHLEDSLKLFLRGYRA